MLGAVKQGNGLWMVKNVSVRSAGGKEWTSASVVDLVGTTNEKIPPSHSWGVLVDRLEEGEINS